MNSIDFRQFDVPTPSLPEVRRRYEAIEAAVEQGGDARERALHDWDELRREFDSWSALAHLRYSRDTRDEAARKGREECDEMQPELTELAVALKRKLLGEPHRAAVQKLWGDQVLALWETDLKTFDPAIKEDLVAESKLSAKHTELVASARFEFRGERLNLSEIARYGEHADRAVRKDASAAVWGWVEKHGAEFDALYHELTQLRNGMAQRLGFHDFVGLGYCRMSRIDYDRKDVARFRGQIREQVVPICQELIARQGKRLGLDKVMAWDEQVMDPRGNPAPRGDHDWMLGQAQAMFDDMGSGLDDFFKLMVDGHLLDLKSREGKAAGGFCTSFPTYGVPYIFANFNGTTQDVRVFTHEVGHAFQGYRSRTQRPVEYLWPTYESCEIHSMSLEFLTWPHMEKFFGDEADRFRELHLAGALMFLPYGVAIDHFQHDVYENPQATPAERMAMWREMERLYMPWRDYGDIAYPARGTRWQLQGHVFGMPFYYIDYVLAQICALQFWTRAESDRAEAMAAYVALCERGGEASFQSLARGAGLQSPFEDGSLAGAMANARRALKLS